MLFKKTVSPSTLNIIRRLCSLDELIDFELVGGTSLSLQIGHRISVDIDLFCKNNFDPREIKECLLDNFSDYPITFDYEAKNTLIGSINQIKIDFIRHAYPTINETKTVEGVRLCSMPDIAAMKINAITDNGSRIKDFVDLYYLLHHFRLDEILRYYQLKYQSGNVLFALKSIIWFNDLENYGIDHINFLKDKKISFDQLRSLLIHETEVYLKNNIL